MKDIKKILTLMGHMHNSVDYTIGNTRILCNPRGYADVELNPEFTPNALICLKEALE